MTSAASLVPGRWVFIPNASHAYVPIKLTSITDTLLQGTTTEGATLKYELTAKQTLKDVIPASEKSVLHPVENLIDLEELSEATILHNLRQRYNNDEIYTNTSSIVLSINPYKLLPYYGPATIQQYKRDLQGKSSVDAHKHVPPHVYALADSAYKELLSSGKNQSILISGESGAGKTEATKLVLQYLAECSTTQNQRRASLEGLAASPSKSASANKPSVEEQILEANPIIEAFGNARTVRNNNSSRFGKWMEIQFDRAGRIASSRIESYLLEKSRVVNHSEGERNYHIFYMFTQGTSAEEKQQYRIHSFQSYRVLTCGQSSAQNNYSQDSTDSESPLLGNNAVKQWQEVKNAMKTLQFSEEQIDTICRVLSAILHLGNLQYGVENDKAIVLNTDCLADVAQVLGLESSVLSTILLTKTLMIAGKPLTTFHTAQSAAALRDAICKNMYDKLFLSLMASINLVLHQPVQKPIGSIGLLDIFGFENFNTNWLEQVLINYTNEQLQYHFTEYIFEYEQNEYKREQINIPHIEYISNQKCLDLIGGKGGILDAVAEELKLPKGSDSNLLQRMHTQYEKTNPHYIKPKTRSETFGIKHYANDVTYQIAQFCEKSSDRMPDSAIEMLRASTFSGVKSLYAATAVELTAAAANGTGSMRGKPAAPPTLGHQFKQQLQSLMQQLYTTHPHFIRCIKPNHKKMADTFDSDFVMKQLQYLGIRQVIQVRQSGYPIRKLHAEFVGRYKILLPATQTLHATDHKHNAQEILKSAAALATLPADDWRVGLTKVLLRQTVQSALEKQRDAKIVGTVILLQAMGRRKIQRLRFFRLRTAVKALQELISSHNEDLSALDAALEVVVELHAPTKIVQQGKQYRQYLHELLQVRTSLQTAIETKDVSLLQASIQRAQKMQPPATQQQLPELLKAQQLLQALHAHIAALTEAMKQRNLDALQHALQVAVALGVDTVLQRDARVLVLRLEVERECIQSLQAAVTASDVTALQAAISSADDIGLPASNTTLAQARSMLAELQRTATARTLLRASIDAQDANALEHALKECQKVKMNVTDAMYVEALQCRDMLKNASKSQAVTSALQVAIKQRNVQLLESSIQQAVKQGLKDHQLTQQAQSVLNEVQGESEIEAALKDAMECRDVHILQQVLQRAKQQTITHTASYQPAEKLSARLTIAIDSLTLALATRDVSELERAINRAMEVGLPESNATLCEARSVRDATAGDNDSVIQLQHAIKARDLDMLLQAIQRCYSLLPPDHQVLQQAQYTIDELQSEKIVNEMDRAQHQHQQQTTKRSAASAAARRTGNATLVPGDLARRASISTHLTPDEWYSPKYTIHLYPQLRSPDDYARGRLLGKQKMKQSMLQHTKEVIPRSLTKLGSDDNADNLTSIQLFKAINGYMLDRAYTFPDTLAAEVLSTALSTPQMRDEVYIQLIKQLTSNPRAESILRGWQLLALTSETFPPSRECLPYVFKFLHMYSEIRSFVGSDYVQYAMKTLTLGKPAAAKAPYIQHITAFKDRLMAAAFMTIQLPDGSGVQLMIEPSMDCQGVVQYVGQQIGLPAELIEGFGIFRTYVSDGKSAASMSTSADLLIFAQECLLDYRQPNTAFVFRKRLLPDSDPAYDNSIALSIIYHQLMNDISMQRYALSRNDLVMVQAIHEYQLQREQYNTTRRTYDLATYPTYTTQNEVIAFHTDVQHQLELLQSSDSQCTPIAILDCVQQAAAECNSYWFVVQQDDHTHLPPSLMCGVNLQGIFLASITNDATYKTLVSWTYSQINGWANNSNRFCVRVYDAEKCVEQLNFQTKQGSRITTVIQQHVDCLLKARAQHKAAKRATAEKVMNKTMSRQSSMTLKRYGSSQVEPMSSQPVHVNGHAYN